MIGKSMFEIVNCPAAMLQRMRRSSVQYFPSNQTGERTHEQTYPQGGRLEGDDVFALRRLDDEYAAGDSSGC
jgi:hypothetical protein